MIVLGTWFPTAYDTFMKPLERKAFGNIRKKLLEKARGNVLEVGSGTGLNFPWYEHAEKVTAIEPESYMRQRSFERAANAQVPIEIVSAKAEALPFPDAHFDCVVCTLVLCTIPDPKKALAEIRRVCKPEGRLLLFEHVKIDHFVLGPLQEWLTPLWKKLCDGCHINRRTLEWVNQAGFKIISVQKYYKDVFIVVEAINDGRQDPLVQQLPDDRRLMSYKGWV